MQMFVWNDPYPVEDGGGCICYAIAETVDQARKLAEQEYIRLTGDTVTPALGEPTQILDCPLAEWREWPGEPGVTPVTS